jgi:hypothetical protein
MQSPHSSDRWGAHQRSTSYPENVPSDVPNLPNLQRGQKQRSHFSPPIGCIIPPWDESHNSQRTHRHNRTSVGQPHPMEPHLGRIEVRASPRSLSARKTHGHEHRQRNAPCLYLPNRQDTSRLGNFGNPQQTRNRLGTAPAVMPPDCSCAPNCSE